MNELMNLGVTRHEKKIMVSSRDVARVFEKEHRRVLQDVRELQCSEEFRLHNFVQTPYKEKPSPRRKSAKNWVSAQIKSGI